MKIQKKYQGAIPLNRIANEHNESEINTYSCNYINDTIPDTQNLGSIVVDDIQCKNLISNIKYGMAYDINTHVFAPTAKWAITNYIKIDPGTTYTFSHQLTSHNQFYVMFDTNFNYLGFELINTEKNPTFTIDDRNAKYIIIEVMHSDGVNKENESWMQLEKGITITSYTPHKEFDNKQIYSTNEQVIGTWMDKPLYRKVINIDMPDGTAQRHNLYDTGLSSIITRKIYGTMYVSGHMFPLPMYNLIVNESCLIYTTNNGESIDVELNCDFSNYTADIILEYTKIND